MSVNITKLLSLLANRSILRNKAKTNHDLKNEISKIADTVKGWYENLTVEKAIKSILWQGVLREYGTYGYKTHQNKSFKRADGSFYNYNQAFSRGKMLSIDFGVTNIGREFALTHTGIVIADYTNMVVVIPMTSQEGVELSNLPSDIRDSLISIYKKDYSQIENDSYIMPYQIRVVSKNRITKKGIVGSLANTDIMLTIEESLYKTQTPHLKKLQNEKITILENQNEELIETVKNLESKLEIIKS